MNSYESEKEADISGIDSIEERAHLIVKSVTPLNRVFMIDVSLKGIFKASLHLVVHFVNASLSPGSAPKIKQYTFSNDSINH